MSQNKLKRSETNQSTGTGDVYVFQNSPTLITPNLGIPSNITLTNATSLSLATGVTGILSIENGGTGRSTQNSIGITRVIQLLSTNTTLVAAANTDYVYYISGITTVTLPTAVSNTNRYTLVHTDTNTMTIDTIASQTIAFYPPAPATTATVTVQGTVIELFSDGSNWWTI